LSETHRVRPDARDLAVALAGIDREYLVAALGEIFHDEVARAVVLGRRADNRDRLHVMHDPADVAVVVFVVVHF
jgi:hypothetical protein